MAIVTYCTWADVEKILSEAGADARVDEHELDGASYTAAQLQDRSLEHAAEIFDRYANGRGSDVGHQASDRVTLANAIIAAHWVATRRGNPPPESLERHYQEVMDWLRAYRDGGAQIKGVGVTPASLFGLVNRNYDMRGTRSRTGGRRVRVDMQSSSARIGENNGDRSTPWYESYGY